MSNDPRAQFDKYWQNWCWFFSWNRHFSHQKQLKYTHIHIDTCMYGDSIDFFLLAILINSISSIIINSSGGKFISLTNSWRGPRHTQTHTYTQNLSWKLCLIPYSITFHLIDFLKDSLVMPSVSDRNGKCIYMHTLTIYIKSELGFCIHHHIDWIISLYTHTDFSTLIFCCSSKSAQRQQQRDAIIRFRVSTAKVSTITNYFIMVYRLQKLIN